MQIKAFGRRISRERAYDIIINDFLCDLVYAQNTESLEDLLVNGWITDDQYDNFFQSFQEQKVDLNTRLGMLQEAEDNYYITAKYLLELANRSYELFKSSEVEERRQLIKLVLSNLRVEGKKVRYDAIKPFDTILDYSDRQLWLPR